MRIDTQSGIHGRVIAYAETSHSERITEGIALVLRDGLEGASDYSVHSVAREAQQDGSALFYGFHGAYDLTLGEAQREFQRRTGYAAPDR